MRLLFCVILFAVCAAHADPVVNPKLEPGAKPDAHHKNEAQGKTLQDYRSNPVRE